MYQRMKCPCGQNLFDKANEKNCREANHATRPEVSFKSDAVLEVWNFRLGRMVDIDTHRLIENMAGNK